MVNHPSCCPPQNTASGCHVERICGIACSAVFILLPMMAYIFSFLVPRMQRVAWSDGNSTGEKLYLLACCGTALPSFALLLIAFYRVCFTNPGRVPQRFEAARVESIVAKIVAEKNEEKARRADAALEEHCATSEQNEEETAAVSREEVEQKIKKEAPVSSMMLKVVLPVPRCDVCNVYKFCDAHHCSTCGQCIVRMDHHCPWVGQCVGKANHKFFILFLAYISLSGLVFCVTSLPEMMEPHISFGIGTIALWFGFIMAVVFGLLLCPFAIVTLTSAARGDTKLAKLKRRRSEQRRVYATSTPATDAMRLLPRSPASPVEVVASQPTLIESREKGLAAVLGEEGYGNCLGKLWWLLPTTPQFPELSDESSDEALRLEIAEQLDIIFEAI